MKGSIASLLVLAALLARSSVSTPAATVPPCRTAELRAQMVLQGASGGLLGVVVVRNASVRACSLLGPPGMRFLSKRYRYLLTPAPVQDKKAPPVRALRRGKTARALVQWSNWCRKTRPYLIYVLPSRGGTIRFRPLEQPPCRARGGPSVFTLGRFVAD